MKELTMAQVISGFNWLCSVGNTDVSFKIAMLISMNMKAFESAFESFETQRLKCAKKYAKKDENGEPIVDGTKYVIDDQNGLDEEIKSLLQTKVEISYTPIPIDEIGELKIKPAYIDSIRFLFTQL